MFTLPRVHYPSAAVQLLHLFLLAMLLIQPWYPVPSAYAAAEPGILQTIGDFISLGANTVRELQEAIDLAGLEMQETLEDLQGEIDATVKMLEKTFKDNLNVTINSLDAATQRKLGDLERQMERVNKILQDDIRLAEDASKRVIRDAALQVQTITLEMEQSFENIIAFGGITGAFLLDKATFNALLVIAVVMLGLGLLVFIWMFFSGRLPEGFARNVVILFIAIYLTGFGALALPPVRGYAMTYTGVGLKQQLQEVARGPYLIDIFPSTIILGETQELELWGSNLLPENKPPTATIDDHPVPVSAASDRTIVLDITGLSIPEGSHNIVLLYDGTQGTHGIVKLLQPTPAPIPPDLEITAFSLEPDSPARGGNVHVTITVHNRGGNMDRSFEVLLKPCPAEAGLPKSTPGLESGASRSFVFDFTYADSDTCEAVAIVDSRDEIVENDETNNSLTKSVTVRPGQAKIVVRFTDVTVLNDSEPPDRGEAELRLTFKVNGSSANWPSCGCGDVSAGRTVPVNKTFRLTLPEDENLSIFVNGTEADGWPDSDDAMGTYREVFSSSNDWGKGSYNERSSNPANYEIHFTISVTWLPE